jgi:hypothetical protein
VPDEIADGAEPGVVVAVDADELCVAAGGGSVLRVARLGRGAEVVAAATEAALGARFTA